MTTDGETIHIADGAQNGGDRLVGIVSTLVDREDVELAVSITEASMTTGRDFGLVRASDNGRTSNVLVVADSGAVYDRLNADLAADRVHERFGHLDAVDVTRSEVPLTNALNFEIQGVLAGGVTTSIRVDSHGESPSYLTASMGVSDGV